jgi:hypothetical protein
MTSLHSNTSRIDLTAPQTAIISSDKRFKCVVAGRRFGKTFLAIAWMLIIAMGAPRRRVWYVAPTYKMAKRIAWASLKALTPIGLIADINESTLTVTLFNGSTIALHGADNPDSLRGTEIDAVVIDEYAMIDKDLWPLVLRPMLAKSRGPAMFIGTPAGFNHFYDLWAKAARPDELEWDAFQFTTAEGGNIPLEEIEAARNSMSPRQFRQEFEASFEALAARVYYAFERKIHVTDRLAYREGAPIKFGMDFNVSPGMHACVAQRFGDQLHVFDEIMIPNGNTEEMAREGVRRYGLRPQGKGLRQLEVMPDPAGKSRHTNAPVGVTDFTILQKYKFKVCAPRVHLPQADKINTVNAALKTASGRVSIYVHPRCTTLIKSLEGLTYKGDSGQPDKTANLDHMADAFAYLVCWELPMRSKHGFSGELRL